MPRRRLSWSPGPFLTTHVIGNLFPVAAGLFAVVAIGWYVQGYMEAAPPEAPVLSAPVDAPVRDGPFKVEVLNGCGVPRIAAQATDSLRHYGFDVVLSQNYDSYNVRETIVVDRMGDWSGARAVAAYLQTDNIIQQATGDSLLDVTIILGRDYFSLAPFH